MRHQCLSFTVQFINRLPVLLPIFILFLLTGCKGPQSTLDPASPTALAVSQLWWGMLIFSVLILIGMTFLWFYATQPKTQEMEKKQAVKIRNYFIIGGGILLPTVSIVVLLLFGIPVGQRMLPFPLKEGAPLRIDVIGHQWWWEIFYPATGIRLVNELHLPIDRAIDIHATSQDVIHSFWVPRLSGKIDMIPGRTNIIRLYVTQPGRFRAQCAEFCGLFHARMLLAVSAHNTDEYIIWENDMKARKKHQGDLKLNHFDSFAVWSEIPPNE